MPLTQAQGQDNGSHLEPLSSMVVVLLVFWTLVGWACAGSVLYALTAELAAPLLAVEEQVHQRVQLQG